MAVSIDTHSLMQGTQSTGLEDAALRFAEIDPVEAEATIDGFVAGAIAAWRLEDATYWQRVKFRARLIRTMRRNGVAPSGAEAKYLPVRVKVKAAKMNQTDLPIPIAVPDTTASERRTGKRHSLVLLVGKVIDPAGAYACLVHDVSPTGLMARFTQLPSVGQPICIEIRGLPPIEATVRWVKGFKAGVEFNERQDVAHVFKIKREDGLVARAPRFPVNAPVSLRIGAQRVKAEALDISPGGAKLMADTSLQRGQTGQILLTETGTSLFGTVCWAYDGRFGFKFVAPLPLATLSEILANQQTHLAAAG